VAAAAHILVAGCHMAHHTAGRRIGPVQAADRRDCTGHRKDSAVVVVAVHTAVVAVADRTSSHLTVLVAVGQVVVAVRRFLQVDLVAVEEPGAVDHSTLEVALSAAAAGVAEFPSLEVAAAAVQTKQDVEKERARFDAPVAVLTPCPAFAAIQTNQIVVARHPLLLEVAAD
jgi:hypothetical protein